MLSKLQMDAIYGTGALKRILPLRLRGLCSELGLYVQMEVSRGVTTVKAGGRFIAKVHLRQDAHSSTYPMWEVKKYNRGDWEELIEPTYQLTCWIYERHEDGLLEHPVVTGQLRTAIKGFRKTGTLELPHYERPSNSTTASPPG